MKTLAIATAFALVASVAVFGSQHEDRAADSVAAAFAQARNMARLPKLQRISGNTFRPKVCKNDLRFTPGLILTVRYQTSDPGQLSEAARRLAIHSDDYRATARYGIGVCAVGQDSSGEMMYSVLIATYESRWSSFLRIFWE